MLRNQRPLGIPEFQDRIVQAPKAIRIILDAIFDPQFLEQSHGFRPNRSQHSCVKYIRAWFPGTVWYIEGDIQKCFDSIDHDRLMKILKNKIADKKFLQLIGSGLKANVLLLNVSLPKQNSVFHKVESPAHFYRTAFGYEISLHELDKFLLRFKRIEACGSSYSPQAIDRGKRRRENPEYHKDSNRIYRARR